MGGGPADAERPNDLGLGLALLKQLGGLPPARFQSRKVAPVLTDSGARNPERGWSIPSPEASV